MIAGVIGATGYAGSELLRLLAGHASVSGLLAASSSAEGEPLESVYPHFSRCLSLTFVSARQLIDRADVVFCALPNGCAGEYALAAAARYVPFIDISADFRFDDDEQTYAAWYGMPFKGGALHTASVYGLPELNRAKIAALGKERGSKPVVIGNPGCYPTAVSLAAFPALALGLVPPGAPVIADALSGVSGAGRSLARMYHFPECAGSAAPYKVGSHRHTPEISRNFFFMEREKPARQRPLIFTPHLVPMNRGILATVYIPFADGSRLKEAATPQAPRPPTACITEETERARELYAGFYRQEPFVRVLPPEQLPATNRVRGSNFCDIAVNISQDGAMLIVTSAIDNLVKGAAGQAIQNMNIIFGFNEQSGLSMPPTLI